MIVITDPTYAALSAPQRAVLALQAAWAGKRPDPALLVMSREQRAEFDRLYRTAVLANVRLGQLIRTLHAQAGQERIKVLAWELEALHAGMLDEVRWTIGEAKGKVAEVLEGGRALCCPVRLNAIDETPEGRRWQVLKAARLRLFGIVNRAHATAEILEVIQGELGADPLEPSLRRLLDETLDLADDVLWRTIAWLGPVGVPDDPVAYAEVEALMELA
jgi:hypothetical protein